MKDFSNDKNIFNQSIKKKFDAARIEPSDAVWEGIEGALLKHENGKMQKRAVFYRNIAAAVLLIAVVSIYFNLQEVLNGADQNAEVVDLTELTDSNLNSSTLYANQSDIITAPQVLEKSTEKNNFTKAERRGLNTDHDAKESLNSNSTSQQFIAATGNNKEGKKEQFELSNNSLQNSEEKSFASIEEDELTKNTILISDLSSSNKIADNTLAFGGAGVSKIDNNKPGFTEKDNLVIPDIEVEEVSYFAVSNLDKVNKESSFAFQSALNVGSGNFNPNANAAPGAPQPAFASLGAPGSAGRTNDDPQFQAQNSAERQIVDDLSNAPIRSNVSMTFGVQFGLHLNDRLKIRTGLQYGNYRSSTESSAVIRDINSDQFYPYHGASNATILAEGKIVNVTSEYNVYNDFQILSVPLIVSYKFLDRKFGIGLVAGATADIMLKNTIRGGDNQISEISFENNESQYYRNLFYSGLAGLEFSYNFSENYALSLTPTYKRALMNITTDKASFNSSPDFLSIDMSLQFTF